MSIFDFITPKKSQKEKTKNRTGKLLSLEAERYKEEARKATNDLREALKPKKEQKLA